ncbi:MAG: hypothetical protein FWE37_03035 [Spirochaetaceae bacterium]|nr:hypothetical protein [Spirochaetaceae bacterium]
MQSFVAKYQASKAEDIRLQAFMYYQAVVFAGLGAQGVKLAETTFLKNNSNPKKAEGINKGLILLESYKPSHTFF